MAKRSKSDPTARRKGETHLQWRSRIAQMQETARKAGEDIVTPERKEKGDLQRVGDKSGETRTYQTRSTSSLARLNTRGVITDQQLDAAKEIALIRERIGQDVGVRGGAVAARVDCEGSNRDFCAESLSRIRAERAYSIWRLRLPLPRALVVDMIFQDHQLAAIAKSYNTGWPKAIERLRDALDLWWELKREMRDAINQDDVDEVVRKIA